MIIDRDNFKQLRPKYTASEAIICKSDKFSEVTSTVAVSISNAVWLG